MDERVGVDEERVAAVEVAIRNLDPRAGPASGQGGDRLLDRRERSRRGGRVYAGAASDESHAGEEWERSVHDVQQAAYQCFVTTSMTPPMFPVPNLVVASHARYMRMVAMLCAGIWRSDGMEP